MMRVCVCTLLAGAIAVALLLTAAQGPFDNSSFAFQQYGDYAGTIFTEPAPTLATAGGSFLLTRPGKFGAQVDAWRGVPVKLGGALIQSGADRMLEIEPGSVRPSRGAPISPPAFESLGYVDLIGEIADGKCYFGVMNPGRGKVHRDCAVRCLSGGAPPVFLVRDAAGTLHALLLTGAGREILRYAAEPVRVRGELQRSGARLILKAAPSGLRRE